MSLDCAALLRALLDDAEELVVVLDPELRLLGRSVTWTERFGDEVGFLDSLLAGSRSNALRSLRRVGRARRTVSLVHLDRGGRARRVAWSGIAAGDELLLFGRDLADDDRRLDQLLRLQQDARRASAELRRLASTDPLTGVANRRAVLETARWVWGRPGPATAVLLDLDHFKHVNDRYGHEAGDALLEAVGERLQATAGPGAVVGRWGGEEFACFYVGDGTAHAEAMLAAVRAIRLEDGGDVLQTTASVGVALAADTAGVPLSDAIAAADAALYVAKKEGRDRLVTRRLRPRSGEEPAGEERRARRWRRADGPPPAAPSAELPER